MTFILRVSVDEAGVVSGVVERVRTGEKKRFAGLPSLGNVVARMLVAEEGRARDSGWDTREA